MRSKPIDICLSEYKELLNKGYKYFRITAEDIGDYGVDAGSSLAELLDRLSEADKNTDVKWISSAISPQGIIKYRDKFSELGKKGKLAQINCAIQSGNERILKLMNRRYDIGKTLETLAELRKANEKMWFNTQIMVGFPSETDEEFRDTINIMEQIKSDSYQIFPYSDKQGTAAFKMPDKVPKSVIERRLKIAGDFFKKEHYYSKLQFDILFAFRKQQQWGSELFLKKKKKNKSDPINQLTKRKFMLQFRKREV